MSKSGEISKETAGFWAKGGGIRLLARSVQGTACSRFSPGVLLVFEVWENLEFLKKVSKMRFSLGLILIALSVSLLIYFKFRSFSRNTL